MRRSNKSRRAAAKRLLFVEDISGFVKDNAAYGVAVANRIRQSVVAGRVQIISVSTDEEFNSQIVADVQLNPRFQKIDQDRVGELTDNETVASKLFAGFTRINGERRPESKSYSHSAVGRHQKRAASRPACKERRDN